MLKMVRWSVGAGSVPGGALGGVGGARSGVLLAGEGRVPSRGGHVGRGRYSLISLVFNLPQSGAKKRHWYWLTTWLPTTNTDLG